MAVRILWSSATLGCKEALASLHAIRKGEAAIAFKPEAAAVVNEFFSAAEARQLLNPVQTAAPTLPPKSVQPPKGKSQKQKKNSKKRPQTTVRFKPLTPAKNLPKYEDPTPELLRRNEQKLLCPFCISKVLESEFCLHLARFHNIKRGSRYETPIENLSFPDALLPCPVCSIRDRALELKRHIQQMHPECVGSVGYVHFVQGGLAGL